MYEHHAPVGAPTPRAAPTRSRRRPMLALVVVLTLVGSTMAWGTPAAQAAERDPVIIVAGTFSPAFANEPLRARLTADGFDAYIFELPGLGLGDIAVTSQALGPFVDQVLAVTGADKVDLVGHSQGGLVARYYVKELGGDQTVDSVISLGAPHKGTYVANIANVLGFGSCIGVIACTQMRIGSTFLDDLNAGSDTIGDVKYTNIYTSHDELVRPVDNATLGDGAVNVRVQSRCWLRYVGHLGLIVDGAVYSGVRQALDDQRVRLNCWAL